MMTASSDRVDALVAAIRAGDVYTVHLVVRDHPALLSSPLGSGHGTRTALHVATDWPGYFPNAPQIVHLLIEAGADPNARCREAPRETPLHWAASSDDFDVAEALIDRGADVEAANGSIGTPLDNAIGYGCWHVARLLVARGATVEKLWHAAALGMLTRLEDLAGGRPGAEAVSQAFWHACAAGQRRAAEYLLGRGADLNWVPDYAEGTPLDAASAVSTRRQNVVSWLRDHGAASATAGLGGTGGE